ncbi:hypothetical protein EDC94DRAFT_605168 [Helicostylum pulchrum]|nr:hypothetical protein EDC94DRAFT_605168 [Helicostylum pulchrum]
MLTLKHSMQLSLTDTDANNLDGLIGSNLLPTVSYIMIYGYFSNTPFQGKSVKTFSYFFQTSKKDKK